MRSPVGAHPVLVAMAAVSSVVAFGSCAIQPDSAPREIPVDQRGQLDPVDPGASESTGTRRVFMLADGESDGARLLRSVSRAVAPTAKAVLEVLLEGPNAGELELGMTSALPAGLTLLSARVVGGILNVDLSDEILELPGAALRDAVAQIVFTAQELDGVRAVRLRVDGVTKAWPGGQGELQPDPLTIYDFPGLAESAQPSYPPVPSDTVA